MHEMIALEGKCLPSANMIHNPQCPAGKSIMDDPPLFFPEKILHECFQDMTSTHIKTDLATSVNS